MPTCNSTFDPLCGAVTVMFIRIDPWRSVYLLQISQPSTYRWLTHELMREKSESTSIRWWTFGPEGHSTNAMDFSSREKDEGRANVCAIFLQRTETWRMLITARRARERFALQIYLIIKSISLFAQLERMLLEWCMQEKLKLTLTEAEKAFGGVRFEFLMSFILIRSLDLIKIVMKRNRSANQR